jgi:hypothetical protein
LDENPPQLSWISSAPKDSVNARMSGGRQLQFFVVFKLFVQDAFHLASAFVNII